MSKYEIRTLALLVNQADEPVFAECGTRIEITDEAAGEYVVLRQPHIPDTGTVMVSPQEWPTLREAIDRMIAECRE